MHGQLRGDLVIVGGDARQRFHDSRGYGRPVADLDGLTGEPNDLALAPVEAAHLLFRGDLAAVDGMDFSAYLDSAPDAFGPRFLVYKDLRDRGFYLSPAREAWVADPGDWDFVVHPRGTGPGDGEVAYRVRAVGERTAIPAATLVGDATDAADAPDTTDATRAAATDAAGAGEGDAADTGGTAGGAAAHADVLAVVDEEGELTYLEIERVEPATGEATDPPTGVEGTLLDDRVVVWQPPDALYERGFYGQPLDGRDGDGSALHLSLVEAAFLAAAGALATPDLATIVGAGRRVEGERFDRRLRVYRALRERGLLPKTGFKFGADFRVYDPAASVADLGHATSLVRVLPPDHAFAPRDLALDVRLAHGVRKEMRFALPADGADGTPTAGAGDRDAIDWLAVRRLTP